MESEESSDHPLGSLVVHSMLVMAVCDCRVQSLLDDSRDGAGFTAEIGNANVRFVLGLSRDCSLRLLKLDVRVVVFVGVGGASPSKTFGRSSSQNNFLSSPSKSRMLARRAAFAAELRWKMESPLAGWPKVSGARDDKGWKGVEGMPAKEFRLLPFLLMALPTGGGKVAKGLVCFLHGVSGGTIFLSASSSGFRLILEMRPVELNAGIQS